MITAMLALAVLGVGMVIYAVFGVFSAPDEAGPKKSDKKSTLSDESKEQRIQRLQKQVAALEDELSQVKIGYEKEKSEFTAAKEKEVLSV